MLQTRSVVTFQFQMGMVKRTGPFGLSLCILATHIMRGELRIGVEQ
jgi:hypothetical protein